MPLSRFLSCHSSIAYSRTKIVGTQVNVTSRVSYCWIGLLLGLLYRSVFERKSYTRFVKTVSVHVMVVLVNPIV